MVAADISLAMLLSFFECLCLNIVFPINNLRLRILVLLPCFVCLTLAFMVGQVRMHQIADLNKIEWENSLTKDDVTITSIEAPLGLNSWTGYALIGTDKNPERLIVDVAMMNENRDAKVGDRFRIKRHASRVVEIKQLEKEEEKK